MKILGIAYAGTLISFLLIDAICSGLSPKTFIEISSAT